jgi:hypothetical protein
MDNFFSDLIENPTHFIKTEVEIGELPTTDDEVGLAVLAAMERMFFTLVFLPNGINHFEDLTNVICGNNEDNVFKKALRLLSHAVSYQERKNNSLQSIIDYLKGKGVKINIPEEKLEEAIKNLKTNIKNYETSYHEIIENTPIQKHQRLEEHKYNG